MKRVLSIVLLLVLLFTVSAVAETKITAKGTNYQYALKRTTAYTQFLYDQFKSGERISYVGMVDITRDNRPELFYVTVSGGISYFNFATYESNSVTEMTVSENAIGKKPKSISLKRYQSTKDGSHIWVLRATTTKKNSAKRFEYFAYALTRSENDIEAELKFHKTWKNRKKNMMFYIDDGQTVKSVYNGEVSNFFNKQYKLAPVNKVKREAAIYRVAKVKKWSSVKSAINKAFNRWVKLPPAT